MEFILIILSSLLFTIPLYLPALFFLSWFAFIPLIYLTIDYDYNHSFIIALIIGFINSIISYHWLYQPLSSVLKMPFSFNLFILFLYFLFSALPLAVWLIINKFLQPEYSYSPFIAALSWTVLEYFRFEFLNFNPFNYFAYTQSAFSLITQYASYGGIFLVSFISVLIASYLVKIYMEPAWKKAVPLLVVFIIIITVPLFTQPAEDELTHTSIELLVSNSKDNHNVFEKIETEIDDFTTLIKNNKSKYIFTPEKSISFDLIRNNYYRDQLYLKLKNNLQQESYLQLGALSAAEGSYDAKIFNSLFLLSDEMEIINRSNKQRNILGGVNFPYLEEVTVFLADYLNINSRFIKLSRKIEAVEIEELNYFNLFAEEIFIPLTSRKVNYGREQNLIVHSAAEEQIDSYIYSNFSFAAAVYRAAESNTDLIRAVSGGYSAYINEKGRIVMKKRINNSSETVNLSLQNKQSYYQKNPEQIINIIIIIFLTIVLIKIVIVIKNKWSSRN